MRCLTIGSFDLLHAGHREMLEQCKRFGKVTVGVNSDRFIAAYKARPPAQTEAERLRAIYRLGYQTVLNDGPGRELVLEERPDVLAIGPDWLAREYLGQIGMSEDELFGAGIILAFMPPPRKPWLSTTFIREGKAFDATGNLVFESRSDGIHLPEGSYVVPS